MVSGLINANPVIYQKKERQVRIAPCDSDEDIKDPEHPYSLEELKVITEDAIEVDDKRSYVRVTFTPTVEHCSMATVIGLCLRVKLLRSLPSRYKISVEKIKGNVVGKGSRLFFLDQVWRLVEGAESCRDETGLKAYRKVDIKVAPGTHATEAAGILSLLLPPTVSVWGFPLPSLLCCMFNKQLNDKERVAAALENPNLLDMVDECLAPSYG
ncbi:Protein AE7 [Vitis vinifera]|uniref:Protein AE7 n=1 Tax=Vitis vinifera TaxID=29760 RepID=A0A438BY62_VITVI|nr:Protein AE7 [Vitis vinifera]